MRAPGILVIGLTGGIGSGKSTAATCFQRLGAGVIDADLIAHQLTSPAGAAMDSIRAAFGDEMIDKSGALNRQCMRTKAFSNPQIKTQLEAILHPLIRAEINRELGAFHVGGSRVHAADMHSENESTYAIIVLPLLFETGAYYTLLNRLLVIDCPEVAQVNQVVQRSALAVEEIKRIMAAQVTRAVRLQLADDVVCNVGTIESLGKSVRALHLRYSDAAYDMQNAKR